MSAESTVQLAYDIATRDGTLTADAQMKNVIVQKDAQGIWVQKRGGLRPYQIQAAMQSLGMMGYNGQLYALFGNGAGSNACLISTSGATATPIAIPAAANVTDFQSVTSNTGGVSTIKCLFGIWTFNGSAFTQVAAPPGTGAWGMAYLDGTYYTLSGDTLYASAYGDPTTWPGLNVITLNKSYGIGVAIVSHLAYVITFLDNGMQCFYDAAISPGAPLAQVQNGAYSIGCFAGESIASYEDVMYWCARDGDGRACIGSLNGLTYARISTPAIDRILDRQGFLLQGSIFGQCVTTQGKPCYLLTLTVPQITLCYDIKDGLWTYWTSMVSGSELAFNGYFCGSAGVSTGYLSSYNSFLLGLNDGIIYTLDNGTYSDNSQVINVLIQTNSSDSGTYAVKFVAAAYLHGDTYPGNINVTYSNDDYQTWAVSRTINMSTQKKQLIRVGSYRKRAWQISTTQNYSFRAMSLELDFAPTGADNQ